MASIINASTSGVGGVITTADNSGDLNIQSGGSTKIAVTSAGVAVTGLSKASLPTGSVLQVVSATKTDTFSTASTTFVDITGLSVSITPTSSSSKILVLTGITGTATDVAGAGATGYVLLRDSTIITQGSSGGNSQFTGQLSNRNLGGTAHTLNHAITYLDSPATTSALTYKIQGRSATGTLYINKDGDDDRTVSSITVMEIAA